MCQHGLTPMLAWRAGGSKYRGQHGPTQANRGHQSPRQANTSKHRPTQSKYRPTQTNTAQHRPTEANTAPHRPILMGGHCCGLRRRCPCCTGIPFFLHCIGGTRIVFLFLRQRCCCLLLRLFTSDTQGFYCCADTPLLQHWHEFGCTSWYSFCLDVVFPFRQHCSNDAQAPCLLHRHFILLTGPLFKNNHLRGIV